MKKNLHLKQKQLLFRELKSKAKQCLNAKIQSKVTKNLQETTEEPIIMAFLELNQSLLMFNISFRKLMHLVLHVEKGETEA